MRREGRSHSLRVVLLFVIVVLLLGFQRLLLP